MNKIFAVYIFNFLLLSSLHAQDLKTEFIQRIEDSYAQMNSLTSDFEQRKSISFLEEDMISIGKFYFEKPGRMKWDQLEPEAYYFIINDDEIIRFSAGKRQKIPSSSPQSLIFREFIIGTVDGSIFKDERFKSLFIKEEDTYRIELTPLEKGMSKRIEKIILHFDIQSLFLNSMVLVEKGGDQSDILFSNQKLNEKLSTKIFE